MQHHTATSNGFKLTLVASLLVLNHAAFAADDITITPNQRQITADKTGILTLRFEVENRSSQAQQLAEHVTLPDGWELVTSSAPFLLASGARETRLIHVVIPRGTNSGAYSVNYQVNALDSGTITSSQTVRVQIAEQAGIKLLASPAPSSLLSGESYAVDFTLENTGNQSVTYKLAGSDEDNYITTVTPNTLTLAAGEAGIVTIKGQIPRNIEETRAYKVTLTARGGGKLAEESVTIPLIARTPKGIGKYQKLPGKLTTRYTRQQRNNTDGTKTDDYQAQTEYHAHGALDAAGEHNIEIRLRNGKNSNDTSTNDSQQSEYQIDYETGEWQVKTGHQSFNSSNLSGNALNGIGVATTYTPKDQHQHKPLAVKVFSGQSRAGDSSKTRTSGASAHYQWDEFETGVSALQYDKPATVTTPAKQETITAVNAAWRGESIGLRTETAQDHDGKAWSVDANGQWQDIGVNVSHLKADAKFDGSYTDTEQSFANARYQWDEKTTLETSTRHTLDNISGDNSREIREDKEHQAKLGRRLGSEQQIEVSLGQRWRNEKDLRPNPTTDRDIHVTSIEYQQQFEQLRIQAELGHGKRNDKIKGNKKGNKYGLTINWQAAKHITANTSYTLSDDLDSDGKTYTTGINTNYQMNHQTQLSGYIQRNRNHSENTHADSFEARLSHDMKRKGNIGFSVRRTHNQASDAKLNHDDLLQVEYTVPLDMPIRKRNNIGSVKGKVRYAIDQRPASEVVVQMGGQYAVTNTQGEFEYPDIVAKNYDIQIDNSRTNSQGYLLSDESGTASLNVPPDQTIKPILELHPASRISGKLQLYEADTAAVVLGEATNHLRPSKGLGMVLIELRPMGNIGKRITHKRTTLADGSFSFVGIPAGQWQLVVVDSDKLPANYRLEQTQFTIDTNNGGTQEISIRALPTIQSIKKTGPNGGFTVAG